MRSTEMYTVLALIVVAFLLRSKAESYISSSSWLTSVAPLLAGKKKAGKKTRRGGKPKSRMGSSVAGQPGMVYGKRGNAVPKTDFARRQMGAGVAGQPGMVYGKRGNAVPQAAFNRRQGMGLKRKTKKRTTVRYTGPVGPPGSAVPGRPGAVFGKAGGIASRAAYERKFGATTF